MHSVNQISIVPLFYRFKVHIMLLTKSLYFLFCKPKVFGKGFCFQHGILYKIVQRRFILYFLDWQNSCYICQCQKSSGLLTFKQGMQKLEILMHQIRTVRMISYHTVPLVDNDNKRDLALTINIIKHYINIPGSINVFVAGMLEILI